jgi:hypothetical protein
MQPANSAQQPAASAQKPAAHLRIKLPLQLHGPGSQGIQQAGRPAAEAGQRVGQRCGSGKQQGFMVWVNWLHV